MTDLFDLVDLPSWLQVPSVDTETATRVRRAASGWLYGATRLTPWPTPVPDDLWAWAIELAAIAFRNPDGAASQSLDEFSVSYDRMRATQIIAAAKAAYGVSSVPQYSFPDPDWHWTAAPIASTTTITN